MKTRVFNCWAKFLANDFQFCFDPNRPWRIIKYGLSCDSSWNLSGSNCVYDNFMISEDEGCVCLLYFLLEIINGCLFIKKKLE